MTLLDCARAAAAVFGAAQNHQRNKLLEELETAIEQLRAEVGDLTLAPWDEGLALLRQASVAGDTRRLELLGQARLKLSDAAARRGVPTVLRAEAAGLTALTWLAEQELPLATHQAEVALEQARLHLAEVEHVAFQTSYGQEANPMWVRLDAARSLVLQLEVLSDRLRTGIATEAPSLELDSGTREDLAHRLLPAVPAAPPAPDRSQCTFIGSSSELKLGSVWHRLRPFLEGDDFPLRWFTSMSDPRLLATRTSLIAYHPDELKGGRGVRRRIPITHLTVEGTGRDWLTDYVVLRSDDPATQGHHRVNLGSQDVVSALRALSDVGTSA